MEDPAPDNMRLALRLSGTLPSVLDIAGADDQSRR
jgi:hypothetical protein